MLPPSFDLKFARADDHLQTLAAEIGWWIESEPYRISEEIDPHTHFRTVYAEPFGNPPLKLSLIVGDVLHCLRSGLDHLALALAEANIGGRAMQKVEADSQFPIYSTKGYWRSGRARRVGCAVPRAQAVLQRLQPWRRRDLWDQHPLWVLRQLSDFDKHRRLPLVGIYANLGAASLQGGSGNLHITHIETHGGGGPLKAKTPLLTWGGIVDLSTGVEMNMNYQIALQVAFAEDGPIEVANRNVVDALVGIRNYVRGEVVTNLQPFLQ